MNNASGTSDVEWAVEHGAELREDGTLVLQLEILPDFLRYVNVAGAVRVVSLAEIKDDPEERRWTLEFTAEPIGGQPTPSQIQLRQRANQEE